MKRIALILTLMLGSLLSVYAFDGRSRWITASEGQVNQPNTWIAFRCDVSLSAVPEQVRAEIAADRKYWLWINGRLAVFEGSLKRGPNPNDSYFDVVELAPYLRKGNNQIAILLWYFGKSGFSHIDSGQSGLLFSAPAIDLYSDAKWLSRIHPAYGACGDPRPNFRLSETSIRYDGSLDIGSWQTATQLDGFQASAEIGRPGDRPWNALVERPIPLWKDFGLKKVKYETRPGDSQDTLIAHLPYNMHITPQITLRDDEGGHLLQLHTDHVSGGSEPSVRAEYITRQGIQTYESLGWMNGDFIYVILPHGLKLKSLAYRQTGYDGLPECAFSCDDEYFNRFWQKALYTLYVNMRDTYFDCPDRERAQWWGDATILMGECFYSYSTRVHHLMRKAILELCDFQRDDDCLHSPIPGIYNQELPAQMLASVSTYGFWNYYMNTGDLETIRRAYPHVRAYLNVWGTDETGLTAERHGGWDWGDWGDHRDIRLLYAGWHYMALQSAANMADLLGLPVEAASYRTTMERVKKGYNACWDGTAYRHPGFKGDTDDRAQALAVISGIAEPDKYPQITRLLHTQKHASPYMEKYVMEALFQMGQGEYAMERCRERYGAMVNDPVHTTLYEGWGIGAEGYGGGTWNHAWSGGPLTVIAQYLMGVSPTMPGWEQFRVCPQMVAFSRASITIPTVKGLVGVSFRKKGSRSRVTVTVPPGSRCEFLSAPGASPQLLGPGRHRIEMNQ